MDREQLKRSAKVTAAMLAGSALVGGVSYLVLPAAPVKPPSITLAWDCSNAANQTFEFVRKTNFEAPWEFYTNVIGTNYVTFPRTRAEEYFTISKTWLTGNTNFMLHQRGFEQ